MKSLMTDFKIGLFFVFCLISIIFLLMIGSYVIEDKFKKPKVIQLADGSEITVLYSDGKFYEVSRVKK